MNWLKRKARVFVLAFSVIVFTITGYSLDTTFNVSISILTLITTTVTHGLDFGIVAATTAEQTVVVAPGDAGAATFQIGGEPDDTVTVGVVESSVYLDGDGDNIEVNDFTIDGVNCTEGAGTLNASGELDTCSVGATATINADQIAGSYSGSATLRVVYN